MMAVSSIAADVEVKGLKGEIKYIAKRWLCFFPKSEQFHPLYILRLFSSSPRMVTLVLQKLVLFSWAADLVCSAVI